MDNRELGKCARNAAQNTLLNSHGMARKKRFALVYGTALHFVAQQRPEEYGTNYDLHNAQLIAERMTASLARKSANFDSVPIKATCSLLDIKFGMQSIADWLNGGD